MSTTTLDSGAFPAHGIRANRKTPAPWDVDGRPSDSMLGAPLNVPRPRAPRTGPGRTPTGNLRVVRGTDPDLGTPRALPVVTARVMAYFMAGLGALAVLDVFVL